MEFKTSRRNQGNRKRIYKIGHRDNGIFSNVCTTKKKKKCLVIGGGKIALRKRLKFKKIFEADITRDRTRDDNTDSADRSDLPNLSVLLWRKILMSRFCDRSNR